MSDSTQSTGVVWGVIGIVGWERGGVPTEFRWDGEEGGAEGRSQTTGQRVEVIGDPAPLSWREFRRRAPGPET